MKESELSPFPTQEELYAKSTEYIVSKRTAEEVRKKLGAGTIGDVASNKDRLAELGEMTRMEVERAIAFYEI